MAKAAVLADAAGQHEIVVEHAQAHMARETGVVYVVGTKRRVDLDLRPIVGQAGLALQAGNLVRRQCAIVFHCSSS